MLPDLAALHGVQRNHPGPHPVSPASDDHPRGRVCAEVLDPDRIVLLGPVGCDEIEAAVESKVRRYRHPLLPRHLPRGVQQENAEGLESGPCGEEMREKRNPKTLTVTLSIFLPPRLRMNSTRTRPGCDCMSVAPVRSPFSHFLFSVSLATSRRTGTGALRSKRTPISTQAASITEIRMIPAFWSPVRSRSHPVM